MGNIYQTKNTAYKIRGKKARNNGKKFETMIDTTCLAYQKKGLAFIQKTPEPMRVVKNKGKGQFLCVFEKKAQPDYTGVLKNGTSILMEAKHTDGTNLPFDRINSVQWQALKQHQLYGGETYVLISFGCVSYYLVPFEPLYKLKTQGTKKSVNEKDIETYKIPYKNGLVDFLNAL